MADLSAHLSALRQAKGTRSDVAPPVAMAAGLSIEGFREDFKTVWGRWIESGEETMEAYHEARKWVQSNINDRALIDGAAAHFQAMADWIRECNARDAGRAERIRGEVRADKKKNGKA